MPEYLILLRTNEVASYNLISSGSDGAQRQVEVIEDYGGTVVVQRALVGRFDVALLVDFEKDTDCLAYCAAANVSGSYAEALPAFSREKVDEAREQVTRVANEHSAS